MGIDGQRRMSLTIGLFGGGTVGGGVVSLLREHADRFRASGIEVRVVKMCVRDVKKPRDFSTDGIAVVDSYDSILGDSAINCIIELMGGVTDAKDVVFRALKAKKHVITANKALVATFLDELQALAVENQCFFGYEAAVCGGIPIVDALLTAFVGDTFTRVSGIFNGTTNYMLTKMEKGAAYGDVLKEAQQLGFAEADPSADVDGHDAVAKLALLSKLCFGLTIPPPAIPTDGIRRVSEVDFEYAKLLNCTIRLLGVGQQRESKLDVFVSPCMVPVTHPLASAAHCTNMCVLDSKNLGQAAFTGPGAGRFPTANSVVADVGRLARLGNSAPTAPFPPRLGFGGAAAELTKDVVADKWYVRMKVRDEMGIIKNVGIAAENAGVSIEAVLQNPIVDKRNVAFAVMLESCSKSQVTNFCATMGTAKFMLEEPFFMPLL